LACGAIQIRYHPGIIEEGPEHPWQFKSEANITVMSGRWFSIRRGVSTLTVRTVRPFLKAGKKLFQLVIGHVEIVSHNFMKKSLTLSSIKSAAG
jgi:hypothetical protein